MSLSLETARCNGHAPFGVVHTPCRDCQRRTEIYHGGRQIWMRPPPVIGIECASRIAPIEEKDMTEQEGFIEAIAQRDSLIKRLANDYANDADTMAAAHKVERDALKDAARLALDDLSGVGMSEVECLSVLRAIAALKPAQSKPIMASGVRHDRH